MNDHAIAVRTRVALGVLLLLLTAGIAAPWLAPYDPAAQLDIVALKNAPPSAAHWLGTDPFSRDLLSRALFGARASMLVGIVGAVTAAAFALVVGSIAGCTTPNIGDGLMGLVDAIRAIPRKIILLAVMLLLPPPSLLELALVLGATSWTAMSRVVFTQIRVLRAREFVVSAEALGASPTRILTRHVVPHLSGTMVAASAVLVADLLALEAGLSFLGFGVRPPSASWGAIMQDGLPYLSSAWWVVAVPSALLVITVLCVSSVAETAGAIRQRL